MVAGCGYSGGYTAQLLVADGAVNNSVVLAVSAAGCIHLVLDNRFIGSMCCAGEYRIVAQVGAIDSGDIANSAALGGRPAREAIVLSGIGSLSGGCSLVAGIGAVGYIFMGIQNGGAILIVEHYIVSLQAGAGEHCLVGLIAGGSSDSVCLAVVVGVPTGEGIGGVLQIASLGGNSLGIGGCALYCGNGLKGRAIFVQEGDGVGSQSRIPLCVQSGAFADDYLVAGLCYNVAVSAQGPAKEFSICLFKAVLIHRENVDFAHFLQTCQSNSLFVGSAGAAIGIIGQYQISSGLHPHILEGVINENVHHDTAFSSSKGNGSIAVLQLCGDYADIGAGLIAGVLTHGGGSGSIRHHVDQAGALGADDACAGCGGINVTHVGKGTIDVDNRIGQGSIFTDIGCSAGSKAQGLMGLVRECVPAPVFAIHSIDAIGCAGIGITQHHHSVLTQIDLSTGLQQKILHHGSHAGVDVNGDVAVDRQLIISGIDIQRAQHRNIIDDQGHALKGNITIRFEDQTVSRSIIALGYGGTFLNQEHGAFTTDKINGGSIRLIAGDQQCGMGLQLGTVVDHGSCFNVLDIILVEGEDAQTITCNLEGIATAAVVCNLHLLINGSAGIGGNGTLAQNVAPGIEDTAAGNINVGVAVQLNAAVLIQHSAAVNVNGTGLCTDMLCGNADSAFNSDGSAVGKGQCTVYRGMYSFRYGSFRITCFIRIANRCGNRIGSGAGIRCIVRNQQRGAQKNFMAAGNGGVLQQDNDLCAAACGTGGCGGQIVKAGIANAENTVGSGDKLSGNGLGLSEIGSPILICGKVTHLRAVPAGEGIAGSRGSNQIYLVAGSIGLGSGRGNGFTAYGIGAACSRRFKDDLGLAVHKESQIGDLDGGIIGRIGCLLSLSYRQCQNQGAACRNRCLMSTGTGQ